MQDFDVSVHIDTLYIHPVKSCAAVVVQSAVLTETGLQFDREWMIVDADGRFLSQRELARMVLIVPSLTENALILTAPERDKFVVPFDTLGAQLTVTIWDDRVFAIDMGDEVAVWLSEFLQQPVRLVRFDKQHERVCSVKWTKKHHASTLFADGYPILVSSLASIAHLNERLADQGAAPINALRFRPNIVLADVEAYDEDFLDTLHIGNDIQLKNVKPCTRCSIPDVNPETAERNPIVTDTLLSYRRNAQLDNQLIFGMNAIVMRGAGTMIRVGDTVGADYVF